MQAFPSETSTILRRVSDNDGCASWYSGEGDGRLLRLCGIIAAKAKAAIVLVFEKYGGHRFETTR